MKNLLRFGWKALLYLLLLCGGGVVLANLLVCQSAFCTAIGKFGQLCGGLVLLAVGYMLLHDHVLAWRTKRQKGP